jgi:hypothetical protein
MNTAEKIALAGVILPAIGGLITLFWSQFHKKTESQSHKTTTNIKGSNSGMTAVHNINSGGGPITSVTNNGLDPKELLTQLTEESTKIGRLEGNPIGLGLTSMVKIKRGSIIFVQGSLTVEGNTFCTNC